MSPAQRGVRASAGLDVCSVQSAAPGSGNNREYRNHFYFGIRLEHNKLLEKPYNRTVYTHPNYTISSSTQMLCGLRGMTLVLPLHHAVNQMVFKWSIFDTPFTSE